MMNVKRFVLGALDTNCYVLWQDGHCLIIDAAFDESGAIEDFVYANSLLVDGVLLTHGHFDHCGGADKIAKTFSTDVFCHENDVFLCRHASGNVWGIPCENCFPSKRLVEGRMCVGNFRFDVLETPGHTEGSVCLLFGDVMFAGDTLFFRSVGRTDLPEGNPEKMRRTLEILKALPADYSVFCGHGRPTTLFDEIANSPYFKLI